MVTIALTMSEILQDKQRQIDKQTLCLINKKINVHRVVLSVK